MDVLHDSRNDAYRAPYGALKLGQPVTLSVDVYDAPDATVALRTWVDGIGEGLYEMTAREVAESERASFPDGNPIPIRHHITLTPDAPGVVWYHFIVVNPGGETKRYGARDGKFGGEGELRDWEPPSFQLTVYDPETTAWPDDAFGGLFGDALVGFLRNEKTAHELAETIAAVRENYPADVRARAFDVWGTRSRARLIARLAGLGEHDIPTGLRDSTEADVAAEAGSQPEAGQPLSGGRRIGEVLEAGQFGLAKGRLWCASLIQGLMPDIPPAYVDASLRANGQSGRGERGRRSSHGGRAGRTAASIDIARTWGFESSDCAAIVGNVLDLRRTLRAFEDGSFSCFAAGDDVLGIWRRDDAGRVACVLVNASLRDAHDVAVPMAGEAVSEVIGGYGVPVVDADEAHGLIGAAAPGSIAAAVPDSTAPTGSQAAGRPTRFARVHLNQLGSAILYFHGEQLLERPMQPGLGVLAHITSLPMDGPLFRGERQHVIDEMSAAMAEAQSDEHLASCMTAVEAVLGDSGLSAAAVVAEATEAVDPLARRPRRKRPGTMGAPAREFVDWLAEAGVRYWQVLPVNPTDDFGSPYAGISAFAGNIRLLEGDPIAIIRNLAAFETSEAYVEFCEREKDWLEPYVSFMAIRHKLKSDVVWQKWPKQYRRFDPELVAADPELHFYAGAHRRAQYAFHAQWKELRAYANERGVQIIGDMPIYVSADSADVWANPDIFELKRNGQPAVVAGCPPDAFAVDGQVWGNPVYDWDAVAKSGYAWWLRRLERSFDLYDFVRLDHFIGFSRYFSIPEGASAADGWYRPGPGVELFEKAYETFGPLPVIAEDLGSITPAVRALDAACGFPGMDIVQFVDGNDPLSGYEPRPNKIAYTGTHDNQTLLGYARGRYQGTDARAVAADILQKVVTCSAPVRILPLQDVLGLGDDARMNVPGVAEGNWTWQADGYDVDQALSHLKRVTQDGDNVTCGT